MVVEEDFEDVAEVIIEIAGPTLGERPDIARENAGLSITTGVP